MAKSQKSEDVPKAMQAKYDSIVALTDEFAHQHLNEDYAQLIRQATAALCRKRPSPIEKGQAKTWAAGVTHALGMVNFLYDKSQEPYISANDLYQEFGVSASSALAKSKLVRDTLKMHQLDPEWSIPSMIEFNPLVWTLSVNGMLMDIRQAPLGAQVEAYRQGMIPYIPGHEQDSEEFLASLVEVTTIRPTRRSSAKRSAADPLSPPDPAALQALYTLAVILIDGPITEKFIKKNPEVIRIIEIRGNQTLADLHKIIFQAFNRQEEHFYEFQVKGSGPNDPDADRYGLAIADNDPEDPLAGDVAQTPIGALDLEEEESFGYWFDFGDDWWHQIQVLQITQPQPKLKYPRITQRIGASPPQYAEF